jgi:hypothetical protein
VLVVAVYCPRGLSGCEHPRAGERNLSGLRVGAKADRVTEVFIVEDRGCLVDEVHALGHEDPGVPAGHRSGHADVAHAEDAPGDVFAGSQEAAGSPGPQGPPGAGRVEEAQDRRRRGCEGPLEARGPWSLATTPALSTRGRSGRGRCGCRPGRSSGGRRCRVAGRLGRSAIGPRGRGARWSGRARSRSRGRRAGPGRARIRTGARTRPSP